MKPWGKKEFLQEKKQEDIKEKEMECKLQNMEEKHYVLQILLDEALHKNAEMLQEKEQQEEIQKKNTTYSPRLWKEKSTTARML